MLKATIVGKIVRAGAIVKAEKPFISFSVSVRAAGADSNIWVEVYVRSVSEKLLTYLTEGAVATVTGDLRLTLYDSYVDHCKRISYKLYADSVFPSTFITMHNEEAEAAAATA